jgi:hypothetical protein
MRYLKKLVLNRRIANDPSLYIDGPRQHFYMNAGTDITLNAGNELYLNAVNNVYMNNTQQSLVLPIGNTAHQPGKTGMAGPQNGMIRYNSQTNQFEGYQSNKWRQFKFKEASQITQQNLGAGDDATVYYGPLSSVYNPTNISSDVTNYGGQNIIVVVENVIQLHNINYTVVQNPDVDAETYIGTTTTANASGVSTLYFNTSVNCTVASGNGTVTTLSFASNYVDQYGFTIARAAAPFAVGSTITVTGFKPAGFNGVFTVASCSATQVTYSNTVNTTATQTGNASSTLNGVGTAIYPSVDITNAVVTGGANIQNGTTVTGYSIDSDTDALVSIVISKVLTGSGLVSGSTVTIGEAHHNYTDGSYWLHFSSPVPYGKVVTVLLGFDQ